MIGLLTTVFVVLSSIFIFTKIVEAACGWSCTFDPATPNQCYYTDPHRADGTLPPRASCTSSAGNPDCSLCPDLSGGAVDGPYDSPYDAPYDSPYDAPYLPDFQVTNVAVKNSSGNDPAAGYFEAGERIYVTTTLTNSGNGYPCCASRHGIYKDTSDYNAGIESSFIDSSANWPVGFSPLYESWSGGTRNYAFTSSYFTQADAGDYTVRVVADYNNAVGEWNNGNNVGTSATYRVRSEIYGYVCNSTDEDAQCDVGEPKVSGVRIELWRDDNNNYGTYLRSDTTADAADDHDYSFTGRAPADYQVRINTTDWIPLSSANRNVTIGPNTRIRFAVKPAYTITGTVFIDTNRNGVQDAGETTPYAGATVTLSGADTGTTTTNASGVYTFNQIPRGTYTITITEPDGYKAYPSTTRSITIPLNSATRTWTADFGLNVVYDISGRVYIDADQSGGYNSANDKPMSGLTVSVTGTNTGSGTTGSVGTYSIRKLEPGTYSLTTAPPSDYTSLTSLPISITITNADITGQNIRLFGRYRIDGNVFVDEDRSNYKNGSEANYLANPGITVSNLPNNAPTPIITNNTDGTYLITGLISGQYTVRYNNLPSGYIMNHPRNGPPPSFVAPVGSMCSPASPTPGGNCNNGNLENLDFAIKSGQPWYQALGLDVRFDSGISNQIPPSPNSACVGAYAMLPASSSTPGISFSGGTPADFWQGQSAATPQNWVVGGINYPETFSPTSGTIKTSYNYMQGVLKQSNITTTDLSTICTLSNCSLPGNMASGVYQANSSVTLNANNFTGNKDIVILINGNLTIKGTLHVPTTSTVFYSVSGSITVDPSVGSTASCPPPTNGDIEGFFSSDSSFTAASNADCQAATPIPDKQLNVQGAIVIKAGGTSGGFVNQRDLCTNNINYPSFTIKERPDFILNAPDIMKVPNYIWQEVAP